MDMMSEWKLGCFTRPYRLYGVRRALEGISATGLKYVGFMGRGIFPPSISEEELNDIARMLADYGLKPLVAWGRFRGYDDVGMMDIKRVIDNSVRLGIDRVLMAGPSPYLKGINIRKPTSIWMQDIERFFKWIRVVSSYAADKGVKIVLKPHGGLTGTAKECLETMKRINSENVRIWYDPGNVVYYEGLRPQDIPDDLKIILDYVDGICLKDITGGRGGRICAPGQGTIDFREIFLVLRDAGFKGPCVIEFDVSSETSAEEIDSILQRSVTYLRNIIDSL